MKPEQSAGRHLPPGTLPEVIEQSAQRWPDAEALVLPAFRCTFRGLRQRALAVAAALVSAGLRKGDRIGLLRTAGTLEHLELVLGAALAGVVPALFNDVTETGHLHTLVADLGPKLLFTADAERVAGWSVAVVSVEAGQTSATDPAPCDTTVRRYGHFLAAGRGGSIDDITREAAKIAPDDVLMILFTSAVTTGVPKTCSLSHRDILGKVEPFCERLKLSGDSRIWIPLHMFQVGFMAPWIIAMAVGATVIATEKTGADATLQLLRQERITHAYPVYPSYWLPLIYHLDFFPSDFAALTHVVLLGPLALLKRLQRSVPQSTVMNTYGGAETAGGLCMPSDTDPAEVRLGAIGRPFDGYRMRIIDPRDGTPCGRGAVGEIQVFHEGSPVAPPSFGSRYTQDGWLQTSDLGSMSAEGVLYYHGRLSEMLNISGRNISAITIEAVLSEHPAVSVAQVIGIDDAAAGQVPAAFVQLRPGYFTDAVELREHCIGKLPECCIPRSVTFINEWPMSASKIQKARLAEMLEYQPRGASF